MHYASNCTFSHLKIEKNGIVWIVQGKQYTFTVDTVLTTVMSDFFATLFKIQNSQCSIMPWYNNLAHF